MNREGTDVARCTVARLMTELGLAGAVRGKPVKTTTRKPAAPCPEDRVNRRFQAARPNALWLSDFTYVATWAGFVYVAFVIDAFASRIVGWRVSSSMQAGFVLDALEQALYDRRPLQNNGLIHHSDRGAQYVSIKYTERLAEAGIEPSVGSVGNSYENALAESVIGLFKTEVIRRRGPWRGLDAVELPPWNGSTGSTIDAGSSRSETSHRRKPKHATIPKTVSTASPRDSHEIASGKPGAVQ